MLEDVILIGIVMAIVQFAVKRWLKSTLFDEEDKSRITALSVLVLAGLLNVVNALVFAPGSNLTAALAEGVKMGAIAGGVYSLGKAALGKS